MTPPRGQDWDELHLSENPAVELLQSLGYAYVPPETLEAERGSLNETILTKRLAKALRKLNPWLSDDNLHKAVRAVTALQAASLLEASQGPSQNQKAPTIFAEDVAHAARSSSSDILLGTLERVAFANLKAGVPLIPGCPLDCRPA